MTAWEQGRVQRDPSSLRSRRRVRHLDAPGDPLAAAAWADLSARQQEQLRWDAAEDVVAAEPGRAVVLAALQRQLEARRDRWLGLQLLGVLAMFVALVVVVPEHGPQGVLFGLISGGIGNLQDARVSGARRANERVAREGGHPVGDTASGRRWGLERPLTGDPLFGVSVLVVAAAWLLPWPDVHPVTRVLALPVAVAVVASLLGVVRGVVRGPRVG